MQNRNIVFDFDTLGFATNQRIVKKLKVPATIPLTFLISTWPDVDNAYIEREIQNRIHFFENWKNNNPQIKIVTTDKSHYFIHMDEPNLVNDEINEMISKIKK